MEALINFFSTLGLSGYVTLFGIIVSTVFVVVMLHVLLVAMRGRDFSRLMIDSTTGKMSHNKFWSNIAFTMATIAFINYNFSDSKPEHLVEIWVIYLSVIGGVDIFKTFIHQRNKEKRMDYNIRSIEVNPERKDIPYPEYYTDEEYGVEYDEISQRRRRQHYSDE